MRRKLVVLVAACIAVAAFAAVPEPAASGPVSSPRPLDARAFRQVVIADASSVAAPGSAGGAASPDGAPAGPFVEPGVSPDGPVARPRVNQPASVLQSSWKPPRYTVSGYATFYDHGTTAMRLPRGTVVRICGAGGCIERVITDYGPANVKGRIADLYRPDFFAICGCNPWSGTTWVTVSVY